MSESQSFRRGRHQALCGQVVDRQRIHADLGKALSQLFVKAVQAAHVGQDHDSGSAGRSRASEVSQATTAIRHDQAYLSLVGGSSGDPRQRRSRII